MRMAESLFRQRTSMGQRAVRLDPLPSDVVDHDKEISIEFEGRQISALKGDTIATALITSGVDVFSRSFKLHRPRGLYCARGQCPNCLLQVDGVANVRACTTPVHDGMIVQRQNAWPSADRDFLNLIERFSRLLPVGFYYKTFIRPRQAWALSEPFIRRVSGVGSIDIKRPPSNSRYERQYLHADVAVIGGGLAGMAAALSAANHVDSVVLVDDQSDIGGKARHCPFGRAVGPDGVEVDVPVALQRWRDAIQSTPHIQVLTDASAFGLYEQNLVGILQHHTLIELRSASIVVASGSIEQPTLFPNNDLPGVMLGDAVQRLLHLYRVRPGGRVVVSGNSDRVAEVALDLVNAGANVVAVCNERHISSNEDTWKQLASQGSAIYPSHRVKEARGKRCVNGVVLQPVTQDGEGSSPIEVQVDCETLVTVGEQVPDDYFVGQSGSRLSVSASRDGVQRALADDQIYLAGSILGPANLTQLIAKAQLAGMAASGKDDSSQYLTEVDSDATSSSRITLDGDSNCFVGPPPANGVDGKRFVCLCADVSEEDLCQGIDEGFDDIELIKRYSTVTMGPCQGRMCAHMSRLITARETQSSLSYVGATTSRPPTVPVPLAALAGPRFLPDARSSLFDIHQDHGAKMMRTGDWIRPEHYGSITDEVTTVRNAVGMIDVSTLGRLRISGNDAVDFLERIYTGRFRKLEVGKLRYGITCNEAGAIMDEGVVCRLGTDSFFVTTSTAGHASTYQWLNWWKAIWNADVEIVDVSAAYGGINVAGPKAREVLRSLTDLDLDANEFPMLGVREGSVAGVRCIVMRVGFVGELSYEIHFPSDFGHYLWSALDSAGQPLGVRPFGVEAQKILRLEKGHLIVGQDTDGLSDPFSAGLDWSVKLKKTEFIGKQSLEFMRESGPKQRLVQFVLQGHSDAAPPEGCQVVEQGSSVGRVTSCRWSPTLEQVIGLAWVPTYATTPGTEFEIQSGNQTAKAEVVTYLYDPSGERQRL